MARPRVKFEGREYELVDAEDWTYGELSEAEHAIGHAMGEASVGDAMTIAAFVSIRRVNPDVTPVELADKVRRLKPSAMIEADDAEEAAPLDEETVVGNGRADPPTSGMPSSALPVSPSE